MKISSNILIRSATSLIVLLISVCLLSCGENKSSEEDIREYFATIEKLMENGNAGRLKRYISDAYSDKYSHTRNDLPRIAAGYLLRNQSIYLRHHIVTMVLNENDTKANVTLDVVVSREPLSENDPRLLQGDFHRFEVILVNEGDWLLRSLIWQRLNASDFMSGMENFSPADK